MLVVVCMPKDSQWSLTLSDVPNPRTADIDIGVSNRRAALERGMFLCQLGQQQVHAFVAN